MATETNFGQNKVLTARDVEKIARIEPYAAKELLAQKIEVPPFHDVNDQQKALFVSYIYDNIMFAREKGFPFEHVCFIVKFAHEYLKRIIVENHQLSDAIQDFTEIADIIAPLSNRHKRQYTDFVFDTVLCHYNLYKYVFLHLRDSVKQEVEETVEVPPTPMPLSEGENVIIWEYKNKLKEIEEIEAQKRLERQQEMKAKLNTMSTKHKTLDALNSVPLPYNDMILKDLVTDVLAGYTEKKEMELALRVDEVVNDLTFKFNKTTLARPAILGPPPKFRPSSLSPPVSKHEKKGKEHTQSAYGTTEQTKSYPGKR